MLGAAFRKDPVIDLARFRPPKGRAFGGDTDLAGTPLVAFAEDVVREQISKGRVGLLVDYSNGAGRAFIARYTAEAVVNWATARIGGDELVTLEVLVAHPRFETTNGGFPFRQRTRRRVTRQDLAPTPRPRVHG